MVDRPITQIPINSTPPSTGYVIGANDGSNVLERYPYPTTTTGGSGGIGNWTIADGTIDPYLASVGERIYIPSNSTITTITLPAFDTDGQSVVIYSEISSVSINFNGGGNYLNTIVDDTIALVYDNTTINRLISPSGGGSSFGSFFNSGTLLVGTHPRVIPVGYLTEDFLGVGLNATYPPSYYPTGVWRDGSLLGRGIVIATP